MLRRIKMIGMAAVLTVGLGACAMAKGAGPAIRQASDDAIVVDLSASDFRRNVAPTGIEFRHVRPGVLANQTMTRAILCGEFKPAGASEWVAFATIRTSPYENWLGGAAEAHCASPNAKLEKGRDLSEALRKRYRDGE